MANEVKVTITAEDKTKAGIKKANDGLKTLKENVSKAARGMAEFGAAAVAVGLGIERAFKAANDAAEKMGRTDVTAQYAEMTASVELAGEAILGATGLLDGLKQAWFGIEYAARLAAVLIIKGMGEAQIAIIDATANLGDFGAKLRVVAMGLMLIGKLSKEEYAMIDGMLGMTAAERDAAKEAIRLKMAQQALALTNEAVNERVVENTAKTKANTEAIKNNRKAFIESISTEKKSGTKATPTNNAGEIAKGLLDIAQSAASDLADAEKQRAKDLADIDADSAKQRTAIEQDYQDRIKAIQDSGSEDIENAIRGGDALALAQALKSRAKELQTAQTDHDRKLKEQQQSEDEARADANSAYSQALADQKAAEKAQLDSLRLSLMTIETAQQASYAAQLLGISSFFSQAQTLYNAGWAGIASGKSGGSMAPRNPASSSQPVSTSGGGMSVRVTVGGDEAVRAIVRNVIVEEVIGTRQNRR